MFDDTLLESRKSPFPSGRRLSLPVAIALHAAVIGAFVGASAWFTGEAPDPVIPIVYPLVVVSPVVSGTPATGGGEPHRPARPRGVSHGPESSNAVPSRNIEPSTTDWIDSPVEPAEPPGDGLGDSIEKGESTGTPTGGEPGTGGGDRIFRPGGDVREPALLRRLEPDYPEAARRAHLQGTVILEAVITPSGDVQQIRVLKSVNPLLDEAAVRAVGQWRYRPATLNGRAVSVYLTVTVTFGLEAEPR